ncbi:4-aminobutyrate transaminase [Cryptococcus bacillisporus CA1873]|uniref:4-aminobutyrate transaminase n=1 Tax=Cryptococcus bacillisporus CA1873 TaxID=1296111 RepID=A0ABR5BEP0_CRYGA|nr:4-aminobutyrate transaminase [Cryptococcus bacillisporus CA1873]|eukprot:KIR67649.1 4-aminobutyrate transaminase [Cryptococcus gattii CA1873]
MSHRIAILLSRTIRTSTRSFASTSVNMSAPVRTSAQWSDFGREHVSHGLGRIKDHVIVKGEGLNLHTADGKKLLDFTAGIGVTNLGHCHPAVSKAAAEQINNLVHLQCSIAFHQPYLELIEKLLPVMPHSSLDQFFFWNSGSEAVEAAVKLTRKATGKQNVIVFQGAYHGRTMGSGSMTRSKPIYTQSTGPLMPGVIATPYPYWHSLGVSPSTSEEELVNIAKYQLDLLLRQQTSPKDVAAIFIEPVQGEGGYVPCPPAFMKHLREVCDKHGILLVVDEVQTGFFRTGKYFAVSSIPDFRPDVLVFAKGIANGFPLSGIASTKKLMDTLDVGSLGGTYAGNAVACAAGIAAQEIYASGEIEKNVAARSEQLFTALNKLASSEKTKHLIADVRGVGLMTAIEFRSASDPLTHEGLSVGAKIPKDIGKRVQAYCLEKDLLVLTTSCFDTIRFIPALVINEEEMKRAMDIFTKAVEKVALET